MKIIKFNAIWCSGCLVMKSRWTEIENLYSDIEYVNYDYDMDFEEVEKYNIGNIIPVCIFLDNKDNEIKRISGEVSKNDLINIIEQVRGL